MRFCTPSAIKAFHAMLDKVRAENTHLSEAELDAKLCAARDEYCRNLREDDLIRLRARWILDTAK
jgi:histidinol dehydrogenase